MPSTVATPSLATTPAVTQPERTPDPCIVVIFGASGDLTKRKLLPALYHLEQAGLLPEKIAVVGVARRPLEGSFAADMKEGIIAGGGVYESDPKLAPFVTKFQSHAMNFDDSAAYYAIHKHLARTAKHHYPSANPHVHLAP